MMVNWPAGFLSSSKVGLVWTSFAGMMLVSVSR